MGEKWMKLGGDAWVTVDDDGPTAMLHPEDIDSFPPMVEARDTIDRLTEWKDSATRVLTEWERVFEALGRPGPLGGSKASNTLAEVDHLIAENERLRALTEGDPTSIYAEAAALRDEVEHLRDASNVLAAVRNDAMWMARLARGSSWPGEMAHQVEQGAERVLALLAPLDDRTQRWLERAKADAQPGPKHAAPSPSTGEDGGK